jgi:hypothetical protein
MYHHDFLKTPESVTYYVSVTELLNLFQCFLQCERWSNPQKPVYLTFHSTMCYMIPNKFDSYKRSLAQMDAFQCGHLKSPFGTLLLKNQVKPCEENSIELGEGRF